MEDSKLSTSMPFGWYTVRSKQVNNVSNNMMNMNKMLEFNYFIINFCLQILLTKYQIDFDEDFCQGPKG